MTCNSWELILSVPSLSTPLRKLTTDSPSETDEEDEFLDKHPDDKVLYPEDYVINYPLSPDAFNQTELEIISPALCPPRFTELLDVFVPDFPEVLRDVVLSWSPLRKNPPSLNGLAFSNESVISNYDSLIWELVESVF